MRSMAPRSTRYGWAITTALQDGEKTGQLVDRCGAMADLGVHHVVVIARGRPLVGTDLNCVAGAANQLAG
jgi:hypothetical protein